MPQSARHTPSAEVPSVTSYGQVIEYIQGTATQFFPTITDGRSLMEFIANMHLLQYTDRLYLASYTHPPDDNTPFPSFKASQISLETICKSTIWAASRGERRPKTAAVLLFHRQKLVIQCFSCRLRSIAYWTSIPICCPITRCAWTSGK